MCLPWQKTSTTSQTPIDLNEARKILDGDHFGIEKVKKRIIEFLAVAKLKKDLKGPILCLLGPPGVGKTSVGKSIAKALGRSFIRASLGGVRDEAEIRGHRRTYIGAMPGRIIQSIKRVGVKDPLIMLDEIDKIGLDFRGDPASALLEVLDPEQNHTFVDHYLDVAFDLSQAFFITTANTTESIPPALRDRLEIIEMNSYSKIEKIQIADKYLVPKILEQHGMKSDQIEIPKEAIDEVIERYTHEAGVRNLQRQLEHLCRASAEELVSHEPPHKVTMIHDRIRTILGPQRYFSESVDKNRGPGVITGLAWTPAGGEILNIEVTKMQGKAKLILTGHLGDVMKESAQIALSLLRSKWHSPFEFDKWDFHVHVPSGAIPKDGPSAGVAIFLALWSLMEGRKIDSTIAFTGEITLRGSIMPVGGIKEKVLAAHRAGIKAICVPYHNEGDLQEVSSEVRDQLVFHLLKDDSNALEVAGLAKAVSPTLASVTAQMDNHRGTATSPPLAH